MTSNSKLNRQKTWNTEIRKTSFIKEWVENGRLTQIRIAENNDHAQKTHEIQLRSSFNKPSWYNGNRNFR